MERLELIKNIKEHIMSLKTQGKHLCLRGAYLFGAILPNI